MRSFAFFTGYPIAYTPPRPTQERLALVQLTVPPLPQLDILQLSGGLGGTRAYAVGLIAVGEARDSSKNKLPVPDTSLSSQLAQLLPLAVADTLTINEVCDNSSVNNLFGGWFDGLFACWFVCLCVFCVVLFACLWLFVLYLVASLSVLQCSPHAQRFRRPDEMAKLYCTSLVRSA